MSTRVFAEFPESVSTPERKVTMEEGGHAFVDRFRAQAHFEGAWIATLDGIRADWPDGWGLIRCSNTTPSLVLRFDADNSEALMRIQEAFRHQILALALEMQLPFQAWAGSGCGETSARRPPRRDGAAGMFSR